MGLKKIIALVTGGYTKEKEVSVKSAANIYRELDKDKFEVYVIYLFEDGWYHEDEKGSRHSIDRNDFSIQKPGEKAIRFDLAFMCIHGTPGEDGRLQGYFDLIGLPYTSSNHLTAAVTMNKAYTKAIVNGTPGVKMARSVVLTHRVHAENKVLESDFSFPLFIKPNSGGSSIGMSRVDEKNQLSEALDRAFSEDSHQHVLVEEFISGREFSMGVFNQSGEIIALPPSEIILQENFFDFKTKYHSDIPIDYTPGRLTPTQLQRMEKCARQIYRVLSCKSVVRIDFILNDETDDLYFLEVNTIPGQTDDSFVPKQLRAAGINTKAFFNGLINDALEPKLPIHSTSLT